MSGLKHYAFCPFVVVEQMGESIMPFKDGIGPCEPRNVSLGVFSLPFHFCVSLRTAMLWFGTNALDLPSTFKKLLPFSYL